MCVRVELVVTEIRVVQYHCDVASFGQFQTVVQIWVAPEPCRLTLANRGRLVEAKHCGCGVDQPSRNQQVCGYAVTLLGQIVDSSALDAGNLDRLNHLNFEGFEIAPVGQWPHHQLHRFQGLCAPILPLRQIPYRLAHHITPPLVRTISHYTVIAPPRFTI